MEKLSNDQVLNLTINLYNQINPQKATPVSAENPFPAVPSAAKNYLEEAKIESYQKIRAILECYWSMLNTGPEENTRAKHLMESLAVTSNTPEQPITILCRVWKYFLDNRTLTADESTPHFSPSDLDSFLNRHFPSLSHFEKTSVLRYFQQLENGTPVETISRSIEAEVRLALNRIPSTRGQRVVARNRLTDLAEIDRAYFEKKKFLDFFREHYGQKK